ncbi:hypothetical protein [Oenococcus sicerae]|uniref:Uncharacterized protein n=1 Tax=Oenococcus sicerae TaxID=2203724 RepID=A0AAJ1R985_9LACO|nr:hypothetical protein [Oenococcus sicerae]MDN6899585.1 hypothetical protein [Oenococcus sicerae]
MIIKTENIEALIKSAISQYKIHQDTGISQGTISDLRLGKSIIDNLSVANAGKLSDYQNKQIIKKLQAAIGQQRYIELIAFLTRNFNEIVDSQRDLAKSDEGDNSDLIMANILEADFKERLTDPLFIAQCANIINKIK